MRAPHRLAAALSSLTLTALAGCAERTPAGNDLPDPAASNAKLSPAEQELTAKIAGVINAADAKYKALRYEYDEDLLRILDRVEARISGESKVLEPRPMPSLEEAEQLEHFRETVRRWERKSKKSLGASIAALKAEVAARKPGGPVFHPDFHKKFAATFDDFIPIEVQEIRERRNKAIHELSGPIFDQYRESAPDAVRRHEQTLNSPPYNPPAADPPPPPTPGSKEGRPSRKMP